MTALRAVVLLLGVLALGACERGPDEARLEDDIEARLAAAFGSGMLDLAWLHRAGSAPAGAATLVYFDAEIDVRPGHDFTDWNSPGLGVLAGLLGATAEGIAWAPAADGRERLQVHGALRYRLGNGGWVVEAPGEMAFGGAPGRAEGLLERIGAVLEDAGRDAEGPAGAIVAHELETALDTIERRLARVRSVYGLASGAPGGEYWRLGRAYARFAGERGVRVANLSTDGSIENLRLLRGGEADLALVQSDIAALALDGRGLFEREGPMPELRALAALYPEPVHLVAMAGSGIGSVRDLAGRRVDLGPFGSGSRTNALAVLAAHGLGLEDLGRVAQSPPADALAALRRGEVDAVFLTIGVPSRLVGSFLATNDARLVPLDEAAAGAIAAATPGLVALPIPTFSYPRQPAPVPTVAATALLVATSAMPDGEAATILGWTFREMDFLALGSLQGTRISRATAAEGVAIPLHDGATAGLDAVEDAPPR